MPRTATLLLLIFAVSGSLFAGQTAADNKFARNNGTGDPFLTGAPLTFDQVLRMAGQNAIPLARRKQAIQNRGVDFSPTPEQIGKLKSAGAPDDLLTLIKSKSKPEAAPAPRAPKPEPLGSVAVTCVPAECEISLNGTALGPTQEGKLEMARLRPGKWAVDFKKNGYISQQSVVTVEPNRQLPLSVVLEPARATQEVLGAQLFKKVVDTLGGAEALQEQASVEATGSTTIATPNGKSVRWTLLMRNRPDRALFQLRAGGILHEVAFLGSEFRTSKNLKGQEALDLPTGFGLVRDNQLCALITRLRNPQFKILASHGAPVDGEEYTLFAEDGAEKVAIGLDNELRPQRVRITTAAGVGSAIITYSDYCKDKKATYPKTIEIKPDGWPQGLDVRFDTVALSPKLNDNDYKLRGKPLPNLSK